MRQIPPITVELIKQFEGFRKDVYLCPAGIETFGYGSLLKNYPDTSFPISEDDAELCLLNDLQSSAKSVCRLVNCPLNDNQYAALVDFTYNLGSGTLQRSTLRARLNRQEYAEAAPEFLKYVYGGGVKLAGLVKRRQAEYKLFIAIPVGYK